MKRRVRYTLGVFLACFHTGAVHFDGPASGPEEAGGDLLLMWYNTENLFYPEDDTLPGDDEFLPGGLRHWSHARYGMKIDKIAKLVVAAGGWEPPDVVGLCEVEHARVLEELGGHLLLQRCRYRVIHRESRDHRGLDVACLVREDRVAILDWNTHTPPGPQGKTGEEGTRDILYLCLRPTNRIRGADTVDLFFVHFTSKYGGVGATAEVRKRQAAFLRQLADSVARRRRLPLILMGGDFNDEFESYALEPLRTGMAGSSPIRQVVPVEQTRSSVPGPLPGTYKYQGRWSRIDQFLAAGVPAGVTLHCRTLNLPVLFTEDTKYGRIKPARTYEGYRFTGGISDHLPILLEVRGRLFSKRGAGTGKAGEPQDSSFFRSRRTVSPSARPSCSIFW